MYERTSHWDGLTLCLGIRGRVLATVVPDQDWRGTYRVRLPNGHRTDLVNLTRAKDAAITLALAELNRSATDDRAEAA
jgi:hypothetical protein